MNRKTIGQCQPRSSLWIAVAAVVCFIFSCGKSSDNDVKPDTDEDTIVATGNFYKLIRVQNFQGDTTDTDNAAPKATMYYSLEDNTPRTDKFQKTTKWDLSFSSIYGSFLGGNNGKESTNYGFGTTAAGGILILSKKFEDVVDVPADDQFNPFNGVIGTDDAGDFGNGIGYYLYDFGGSLVGDGSYDKQHIAYSLAESVKKKDGTVIPPRTVVVKTAGGNYAKIKIVSVYKDAFTIDKWFRTTPHMFFTFEYVMVPKGSTKFEIK